MKIRLIFIFVIMFFGLGMQVHAQELTVDDFIEQIKSIVSIDMEQEDQLRSMLGNYVESINKINGLIGKNVDQDVIGQDLLKANNKLEEKLKNIFTPDQMHLWDAEKRVIYRDLLTHDNSQNQLE